MFPTLLHTPIASPIYYGRHTTNHGSILLFANAVGICGLDFLIYPLAQHLALAEQQWGYRPLPNPNMTKAAWQRYHQKNPKQLLIKGTPFQHKVWRALCHIPAGTTQTYKDIAMVVGCPKGARAVGQAIGRNPIAYLIPCHRVVRSDGQLGGYGWGTPLKQALLQDEILALG